MGGFFGVVSKRDAVSDVFFGTDYHSHLGTKRGGMVSYDKEKGLYADDVNHIYYSQHMQTWCVLSGVCKGAKAKKEMNASYRAESALIARLSESTDALYDSILTLQDALESVPVGTEAASMHYRDAVVPAMDTLRMHADKLEALTDKSYWPYPTYSDLLFY